MLGFIESNLGLLISIPLMFMLLRYGKHLHKYEYRYYLGALITAFVLAVIAVGALRQNINIYVPILYHLLWMGHLSFALFTLVMFAGAFKRKSFLYIGLVRVRREMAILGYIFLMPHAIWRLNLALGGFNNTGMLAMVVMLPLFVTSFPVIRRKMHPQQWKKLHRLAYVAYFFIFIHLTFSLFVANGTVSMRLSQYGLLYLVLYFVYLLLKTKYYILPWISKKLT